ncbi:cytochrome c3 family protein [Gemmatimonadota bacterium]
MKTGRRSGSFLLAVGALVAAGTGGCQDEDAVGVDQADWGTAEQSTITFLGYESAADKQTLCGNCHPDVQARWRETAHSGAWATLQGSGHAASYCEACHTVNHLGNVVTNPNVGWPATADPRFQDVQCESCHGPGLMHVSNPTDVKPLASFEASVGASNGCGECHEGSHHPFVEQWAESAHGAGPNTDYAGGRGDPCATCHEGQRALEAQFGVDSRYLEKGDGKLRTITCVVCHDPHGSQHGGQLRASIEVPTTENLCMRCHTRRGEPWSSHGPHAAQGLLVLGQDVGYLPPGFSFEQAQGLNPHGPRNNRGLCATCHVSRLTVADASGEFLLESVGHTFEAISCLDEDGLPDSGGACSLEDRSFAACAASGCHATESMARKAYSRVRARLNVLLDELWTDTDRDRKLEADDGGLLPQVIAKGLGADLDPDDSTMTPAKGAMWNAMLAWTDDRPHWSDGEIGGIHFSSHPNSGNGVHNPHLLENLLLASIGHVRDAYSLATGPEADPSPQLGRSGTGGGQE